MTLAPAAPAEAADAEETLDERILSGARDAFVAHLTPDDAERLLTQNVHNRVPRPGIIESYAADMRNGRWRFSGDTLRFDYEGFLLDGQHRLLALKSLKAEAPDLRIEFLIVTGLPPETQTVMDQGVRRTAADNLSLSIENLSYANDIAAAARQYILWTSGRMFTGQSTAGAGTVSNVEVHEWVLAHPEFVEQITAIVKHKGSIDVQPKVWMAVQHGLSRIDPEAAGEFLTLWVTGAGLHAHHPVLTLREKLSKVRRERKKLTPREQMALVILAWNAYRKGRMIMRFPGPTGGSWSKENFPQPV